MACTESPRDDGSTRRAMRRVAVVLGLTVLSVAACAPRKADVAGDKTPPVQDLDFLRANAEDAYALVQDLRGSPMLAERFDGADATQRRARAAYERGDRAEARKAYTQLTAQSRALVKLGAQRDAAYQAWGDAEGSAEAACKAGVIATVGSRRLAEIDAAVAQAERDFCRGEWLEARKGWRAAEERYDAARRHAEAEAPRAARSAYLAALAKLDPMRLRRNAAEHWATVRAAVREAQSSAADHGKAEAAWKRAASLLPGAAAAGEAVRKRATVGGDLPKTITLDLGKGATMKLALIPAGKFMMGSPKGVGKPDQQPQHEVIISAPFYMAVTELTRPQWRAVMGTEPWTASPMRHPVQQGEEYPAGRVSWYDATAFCRKLSAASGRRVRLPTEAEWEYACRAGTATKYHFGDDEKQAGAYVWLSETERRPRKVAQKQPNPWGLFDMHGNVVEWCADLHAEGYYARSPRVDPQGPASGDSRLERGGSHGLRHSEPIPSAQRYWYYPHGRSSFVGFRVVVEAPAPRPV